MLGSQRRLSLIIVNVLLLKSHLLMNQTARRIFVSLLTSIVLMGCSSSQSGPESVTETSIARAELTDRIQFIEKYVTFRRTYEKLDYDIMYQNNGGGMVPAPSDWDIQLIAIVPKTEVDDWVPANVQKSDVSAPEWLEGLPGGIERHGITEWYRKSGTTVGVDRQRSIVAYRSTSTPD